MADLSPELASRIQSLEASYADNPGRYFVALAGAWREGGDIARAEQILRENLKHFPSLSPHVLLGRCLADRGAFPEAANEFHYVLSIDPQNLIALRTLAEMAAAEGRRADAEKWYHELLSVDPMNAEARAALQQLARAPEAGAAPSAPAEPGWGDVELAGAEADAGGGGNDGEFGMIDLSAPDASPADASGVAADDDADADGGEWGDLTLDAEPADAAASADGGGFDAFGFGSVDLDADAAPADPADSADSAGWMDTDARQDVGESAAADASALPAMDDGMLDAPLAGADLPLLDFSDDVAEDDEGLASAVSQPGAGFGFGFGFGEGPAARDGEDADGDVDAEMVTETMAELYASQGLLPRAADVYRELIGQRGEEPGLVRRLAEIESRMAGGRAPASAADSTDAPAAAAPDWLESVDAFARGGADPAAVADAGAADEDAQDGLLDFHVETDAADTARAADSDALDPLVFEPADDFAAVLAGGEPAGAFTAPAADDSRDAPELSSSDDADHAPAFAAAASASADPFADSFASGFDGADAEAAASTAPSGDGRQAWQAPQVAETEPVGFDILVVADEDGAEVPAPPDVVADVSADWAMAAAPLGEDDADEADAAEPVPAEPARAGRTMRGYFDSLLAWAPPSPDAPTYEVTADARGAVVIEPARDDTAPAEAPAPAAMEADAPAVADDVPSAVGTGEGAAEDEPWAATPDDAPWAAAQPGESVADGIVAPAPEELPRLDLDEPWAEAPAPSADAAADIGAFLPDEAASEADPAAATDAEAEELLPWEVPAEPADAAPETPAQPGGGGFSFEDFFAGAPAAPETADAPAEPVVPPASAAAEPAFIPSFAEPTPPPVFEEAASAPPFAPPAPALAPAPAPAPPAAAAPSAPSAAGGQDEDDEDLESFQAWLQSLKR